MLLHLCLLLPLVQAPAQEEREERPTVRPFASFSCGAIESWLVAGKDRALLQALLLFDERLNDLPGEIPDSQIPPEAVRLFTRLFRGPASIVLGTSSEPVPGLPFPLVGELRLGQASSDDARALVQDLSGFLVQMGMPLHQHDPEGAWALPGPLPLVMGESGGDVWVRFGRADGVGPVPPVDLLPDGATVAFSGRFDYGVFFDVLHAVSYGDPELEEMGRVFAAFGLDAMRYEMAMGTDAERGHLVVNLPGWAAIATENGLLSERPLTSAIVRAVPEDATWASVMALDLAGLVRAYREMLVAAGAEVDLFEVFEAQTGLDVEADLVAPFGGQLAFYASDSTGGGGLLSTVGVAEIADREAFDRIWRRLEDAIAGFGRQNAAGRVRISHVHDGDRDYAILSFPGLPVPLEICLTTVGDHAVLAATPQAAQGAAHQVARAGRSLLDNPAFRRELSGDVAGAHAISWMNTPRLLQDGYGTLSLLCSMLSNALRSPGDPAREPGLLLPPYHELRRDARAMVTIGRRVGDDYLSETTMDRSQLVNAGGMLGYLVNSPLASLFVVGALAAVAVPAAVEAQTGAPPVGDPELERMEAELQAGIERVYLALDAYARANDGEYPESLEELVIPDENGITYLRARDLVDPWGDPYVYVPPLGPDDEPFVTYQE